MKKLDRKVWRDLVRMRGQVVAIAAVVAVGGATFVAMDGAYRALDTAQTAYYASHRFANVFAIVKRAPAVVVERIRSIPGVSAANGRIVADVVLDVPGLDEPATAKLVSVSRGDALNRLNVKRGRIIDPARANEVVASELFCRANQLRIGSTLRAVINGRWQELRIVGIGGSPEYVNEVGSGSTFPDYKRFAVLWMSHDALASAYAMQGAVNDVVIALAPGADERRVIAAVDRLLQPFGGIGAYGRDDQVSHRILATEFKQDRIMGRMMPALFVFVAAFLIHMVLSRLVASQREQIAILKAFGYSNAAIIAHFLKLALGPVLLGSLAGIGLGVYLGTGLANLYRDFFIFPQLQFTTTASVLIAVPIGGIIVAVAAAIVSVSRAAAIAPAEGMRGERPAAFHATRFERFHRLFSSAGRMVMRSIERRPVRALLSVAAIAMSVMILVAGRFGFSAIEEMIDLQFRRASREDVTINFTRPVVRAVEYELRRLPGVRAVETLRAVPARVRFGQHTRRIAVVGIGRDARLRTIVNTDGTTVPVPPDGVVLSTRLMHILGARLGDTIEVETLEGSRKTLRFAIVATTDELLGINAYVDRDRIARMVDDGNAVSGAYLSADPAFARDLNRAVKRMPVIGTASLREVMLRGFRETFAKNMILSMTANVLFACVIAFGVIYNNARIALAERGRDLASLRVLGFSHREVGALLLAEQALLTVVAIPLGFVAGRLMTAWFVTLFETDEYRLPASVAGDTYAFAFVIVAVATIASAMTVWRRIRKLDLIEVLKTRE